MTKLEFDNLLLKSTLEAVTGWANSPIAVELGINGIVFDGQNASTYIRSDKITPIELMSLEALLNYTAEQQQKDGALVRTTFQQIFGIDDLKALPAKRYDEAVRFLVDGPVIQ